MTNDKTRISLTFESSNHSSALLFLDNNGDPSIIYLNCYDSTSKVIAGSNLNITFEGKNKAVVQSTQWSFGFALVTYGEDCSISVM